MLMGLFMAVAFAAVPVTLPRGQSLSDWREPLMLAELEPGEPGEGAWVMLASAESGPWWLVVHRADGSVERVSVQEPCTATDREEIAFLAASLLQPLAPVRVAPPPVPEVVVPPRVSPPRRPVAPPPPPPPPPEPMPAPAPAPAPPAAQVSVELIPATQFDGAVGLIPALGAGVELLMAEEWVVGGWVQRPRTADLMLVGGEQPLTRTDVGLSLGVAPASDLRLTAGPVLSQRRVEVDGGPTSEGTLLMLRSDLRYVWALPSRMAVVPSAWISTDLGSTLLVSDGDERPGSSRLGGGLALALRRTWPVAEVPW